MLAAVFIFSGFVKAVDPLGTQYKIQDYLEVFGWAASVPAFLPFLASVLQAMVEFCLGVYLLFGIRRRMTTLFVVLIMGVMTPLTLWLALSNPISDCGCFGDAVTLTNWETFGKNVLLLIAAVSVFKWGNRITPLVTKRFDWLVAMYTFLYISGMTLYCYRELPVFDFRPFHSAASLCAICKILLSMYKSIARCIGIDCRLCNHKSIECWMFATGVDSLFYFPAFRPAFCQFLFSFSTLHPLAANQQG